jgi:hypothetical protein
VEQVARQAPGAEIFTPKMPMEEREKYWKGWQKAISKSLEWVDDDDSDAKDESAHHRASSSATYLDFQDAVEEEDDVGAYGRGGSATDKGSGDGDDSGIFFSTTTLVWITAVACVLGFILGRGCSNSRGSTRRFG